MKEDREKIKAMDRSRRFVGEWQCFSTSQSIGWTVHYRPFSLFGWICRCSNEGFIENARLSNAWKKLSAFPYSIDINLWDLWLVTRFCTLNKWMGISTVGLTAHFELKLKNHCFKSCVTISCKKYMRTKLPPKSKYPSMLNHFSSVITFWH